MLTWLAWNFIVGFLSFCVEEGSLAALVCAHQGVELNHVADFFPAHALIADFFEQAALFFDHCLIEIIVEVVHGVTLLSFLLYSYYMRYFPKSQGMLHKQK